MIVKPLFFLFPNNSKTYEDFILDTHFFIGNDLLCIPHLNNKSIFTSGFLPKETWYI